MILDQVGVRDDLLVPLREILLLLGLDPFLVLLVLVVVLLVLALVVAVAVVVVVVVLGLVLLGLLLLLLALAALVVLRSHLTFPRHSSSSTSLCSLLLLLLQVVQQGINQLKRLLERHDVAHRLHPLRAVTRLFLRLLPPSPSAITFYSVATAYKRWRTLPYLHWPLAVPAQEL